MSVDQVRELIRLNPHISQSKIATKLGLDFATVGTIIDDYLHLCQINRRWTPLSLTPEQRAQRLDWAKFLLEKSKQTDRFVARFDTSIYKCADYWTFDPDDDTFIEKRTIVFFYSLKGVHAVASIIDTRLLSSPEMLDKCLGNEVKGKKRYLYVDGTTHNSARLLENLHDRGIVLVALPECSPDLALGGAFVEPTHWSHLRERRFDRHEDGLKEYKDWIWKVVGSLGSKIFEDWFERISRCVQGQGDYVERINSNMNLNDNNASWRSIVQPNASPYRPIVPNPNTATSDDWQLKEPKIEPKEDECEDHLKFIDNERMKLAVACPNGGYKIMTGPLTLASTIGAMEARPIVRQQQQWTMGFEDGGPRNFVINEQTVVQQQQHSEPASPVDSMSDETSAQQMELQVDEPQSSESEGNVEAHNDTQQQQQQQLASETDDKVYPKPPLPFTCLSALAIKNSRLEALPVSGIYEFICLNFPYFRTAPKGWKNAVRHNLSHSKCLKKIATVTTEGLLNKRRNLWLVDPTKTHKIYAQLRNRINIYSQKIKESMSHPEHLDSFVRGEMKFDFTGENEDSSDEVTSQLEASSASDGCSSQDDEVLVPVAKRQKTAKDVRVYQPAKSRKKPLTYFADPLLEMI